ncbi:hypothetical protein [Dysgonomonas termitidis]|uniref:Uncharacterized protein n=1 Tax=Dysgonomonas termitidis TaxID=1516126 RepID=A0ABV9KTT2_9BACT
MKKIIYDFCGNLGGMHKIYAIPPESLDSISHNYTRGETFLNLTGDGDMIEIYCTPDTMQFTEEKTQTAAGSIYNPVVTGIIPKADALNSKQLAILERGYWLVLFEDNNGKTRLAGDGNCHLIFNRTATTGQTIQNRNQLQFTFSGMQPFPCHFIDAVVLIP